MRGEAMNSIKIRVLFLTPYFRPYLGGVLSGLLRDLPSSTWPRLRWKRWGSLPAKFAFPRIPQPHWADREVTPEWDNHPPSVQLPLEVSAPVFRAPGVVPPRSQIRWYHARVRAYGGPLRGRRLVLGPPLVLGSGTVGARPHWSLPLRFIRLLLGPAVAPPVQHPPVPDGGPCGGANGTGAETEYKRRISYRSGKLSVIGWGVKAPGRGKHGEGERTGGPDSLRGTIGGAQGTDVVAGGVSPGQDPSSSVLLAWCWWVETRARRLRSGTAVKGVGFGGGGGHYRRGQRMRNWQRLVRRTATSSPCFSRYEAFGLVYFEAMAFGLPVLTHDVGCQRRALNQGLRGGSAIFTAGRQSRRTCPAGQRRGQWRRSLGAEGRGLRFV